MATAFHLLATSLFILILLPESEIVVVMVEACQPTAPVSSPVSTAVTTTTPNPTCTDCNLGDITLTPGDIAMGSSTPTTNGVRTGANGCFTLSVTCSPVNGGLVFMQFNTNQGGPSPPSTEPITATFQCVNGAWVFEPPGGPNRVVTEVNCVNT